jgi:hypothetical protein
MKRSRYFDSRGREVDAQDATDARGVLRSGFSLRVPMSARDSASRKHFADGRAFWDANRDGFLVTDGRNNPLNGCRPGFRVADIPINRKALSDAHSSYLNDLQNAYKAPALGDAESCEGAGELDDYTNDWLPTHLDRRTLTVDEH